MKKLTLLTLFILGSFLLTLATPVVASNSDSPSRGLQPSIKQELQDLRQENQDERQEPRVTAKQERKTLWTELKKKQVKMVTARIQKELQFRFEIIQKLKIKIANRITEKSATHDTSAATAKLALFSDSQYQADLVIFQTKINDLTLSDTPKDLMPGIRQAANDIRKDLRNLHLSLVEVMKLVATSPQL